MSRMYLLPGSVSAISALVTLPIDSLIGDSNLTPVWVLLGGNARLSYFAAMVAALFSAGGTASVSVPWIDGHMPPLVGFDPYTVVKPKRTCESSCGSTCSMAVLRLYQDVFIVSTVLVMVFVQTASPVLSPAFAVRQWNMLPDRSTSR